MRPKNKLQSSEINSFFFDSTFSLIFFFFWLSCMAYGILVP